MEKAMAPHSSVLAWRIAGTGKPGWAAVYGVAQSQTQLKRLISCSSSLSQHFPLTCPEFPIKSIEILKDKL